MRDGLVSNASTVETNWVAQRFFFIPRGLLKLALFCFFFFFFTSFLLFVITATISYKGDLFMYGN
jgi:hypothetical protein